MIQVQSGGHQQVASERRRGAELSPMHWQIVDICVRTAGILGVPRSTGEIFGLVFCSPRPISFDDVVNILKLSNGAASHGLRYLRRVGAVRTCYVAQDRRDFYVAEISLQKMLSSFLAENVVTHLGANEEQLGRMRTTALHPEGKTNSNALCCIDQLIGWNQQLKSAVIKGLESLR